MPEQCEQLVTAGDSAVTAIATVKAPNPPSLAPEDTEPGGCQWGVDLGVAALQLTALT